LLLWFFKPKQRIAKEEACGPEIYTFCPIEDLIKVYEDADGILYQRHQFTYEAIAEWQKCKVI